MENVIQAAREHAARDYPRESCGLIVRDGPSDLYVPCGNTAEGTSHFILAKEDYAAASDRYDEIVGVVHSHPDASPEPSEADRVACEASGLPWLIVGWNPGCGGDQPTSKIRWVRPEGYRAPLIGRQFAHGVLDCYSIVRDYYAWEKGIEIPNFERKDGWWDEGQNLYVDNFAAAGFVEVDDPQPGDVFLMHILSKSGVPNHAAIYLGDGVILQHLAGRLSGRDQYGGYYQRHTTHTLRHKSLC